ALDELHHADALAAAEHAQRQPEGRRRFSLARASVDDQQPFLDFLVRDLGILHGLALRHFGAMALGLGVVHVTHGSPFTSIGIPATIKTTRPAIAAIRWLSRPCKSRKCRASALSGTMPKPTSLETSTVGASRSASAVSRFPIAVSMLIFRNIRLLSQSVRQST